MKNLRTWRFRFTLGFLLWVICGVAITLAGFSHWHAQYVLERSHQAEVALYDYGATVTELHGTFMLSPQRLPYRDQDGNIHPMSCGPHVNLTSPDVNADDLRRLLPHLDDLRPREHRSHVAVYLSDVLLADTGLRDELARELPHCVLFDQARYARVFPDPSFGAAGGTR